MGEIMARGRETMRSRIGIGIALQPAMLPNTSNQPEQPMPSQPQRSGLPTDTPLPPASDPNTRAPQRISLPEHRQQPSRRLDDDPSIPVLPIG
jgi:hypothetical protein